jgi:peptidoglycan hydrolase-like protein with peptidoglycan-binding domain
MKLVTKIIAVFLLVGAATVAVPQHTEAATPCTQRTFSTRQNPGSTCVGHIQFLVNLSNGSGLVPDNSFGPLTKAAIKNWQAKKQIKSDGIVGKQTWATLCKHKMNTQAAQDIYNQIAVRAGCSLSVPGAI